jgi:hypothetical protein
MDNLLGVRFAIQDAALLIAGAVFVSVITGSYMIGRAIAILADAVREKKL